MDPLTVVMVGGGLLFVGGYYLAERIMRGRRLRAAAKKVGFEVVKESVRDPAVQEDMAMGRIRGTSGRIGYVESSTSGNDFAEQSGSKENVRYLLMCGVELPHLSGYLMTRGRVAPDELMTLVQSRGWAEMVPSFVDLSRLEAEFRLYESQPNSAMWIRDDRRIEVLLDLARIYSVVRFFDGWLWVGNDFPDPATVDVDFDHLLEARRRLAG